MSFVYRNKYLNEKNIFNPAKMVSKITFILFLSLALIAGQLSFVSAQSESPDALYSACIAGGMTKEQCCETYSTYPGCSEGTKLREALEQRYAAEGSVEDLFKDDKTVIEVRTLTEEQNIYYNKYGFVTVPAGVRVLIFANGAIELQSPENKEFEVSYGYGGKFVVKKDEAIVLNANKNYAGYAGPESLNGLKLGLMRFMSSFVRQRVTYRTPTAVAAVRG